MSKKIVLIALLFGLNACSNGLTKENRKLLEGRWDLVRAEINGRNSDRLRSLFFEFTDTALINNLMGDVESFPYEIKKNQIIQQSQEPIKFAIEKLEEHSLILSTSLHNSSFWIELDKNVTPKE